MPDTSPLDTLIAMAAMFLFLLCCLATAVSEYRLGRYLAKHYREIWLQLGRPGKFGKFGREIDHLSPWLKHRRYEEITDAVLQKKCRLTRRLERTQLIGFGALVVVFLILLVLRHTA